jgi:DnaJ family protein C protein 9
MGDHIHSTEFREAYYYFRHIYPKINEEDITAFEKQYRGGDMEKEDLIQYYNQYAN